MSATTGTAQEDSRRLPLDPRLDITKPSVPTLATPSSCDSIGLAALNELPGALGPIQRQKLKFLAGLPAHRRLLPLIGCKYEQIIKT